MVVHEYLRYLVINTKLVSYEYFMDDMKEWEIALLIPMGIDSHQIEWETARYVSYNNAMFSGNIKKQYNNKSMQELFPLPYDKDYKPSDKYDLTSDISNNQVEVMRNLSKKLSKQMNGKHS